MSIINNEYTYEYVNEVTFHLTGDYVEVIEPTADDMGDGGYFDNFKVWLIKGDKNIEVTDFLPEATVQEMHDEWAEVMAEK